MKDNDEKMLGIIDEGAESFFSVIFSESFYSLFCEVARQIKKRITICCKEMGGCNI